MLRVMSGGGSLLRVEGGIMSTGNSRASRKPMQQDATPCNSKNFAPNAAAAYLLASGQLSEKQRNAIELLLQGLSDVQVAQQIGVDRVTIYRWRIRSSLFRSELARQRQVLWEQSRSRLQSMIQ